MTRANKTAIPTVTTRAKRTDRQQATMKVMLKDCKPAQLYVPNAPPALNVHNSNTNTPTTIHTRVTTITDIETIGRDIEKPGTRSALLARYLSELNQAPHI
jgi:hypothetical protein